MSDDAITYAGWGRALRAKGELRRAHDPASVEAHAPAIGNRRSYGDAALNSGGAAVEMTALDRVLAFDRDAGLLTVEAGLSLGEIIKITAPHGWLPAVVPGTGFATVGGAIAMDIHGKNHHHAGSFCQHVTALTLMQGGGPRRLTPADGALWRATCGGLGQTGIITQATLSLMPVRGAMMLVTEQRARDWDEHIALLDGSDASFTVGWIDATATGAALGRGIVEEGEICRGIAPRLKAAKTVPCDAPHWALGKPVVKAFNAAYYRRVPKEGRSQVRALQDFFFPLDRVLAWNRLYGKRGFHQFQCVVPLGARDALRDMLGTIAASGLASPLAVLKRMGPGRAGCLSFPMEGYTLAVDFPNRAAARSLIARLEAATTAAGGRIYLAKDALSSGAAIKSMYPEFPDWAKAAQAADPEGALQTDLVRRLELRT
ncbi:FAD-binding protein [Thalassorhabdomicrobium marinisediminis]|uniref:FAD-binding protein n=1 Tax=Thalassorhabdomicrobium marinisediminis TaxID=2170577 RepID=UPI00248F93AD|nr:FAD-binding oxidoreductase [Thalassorhabdomicrobium marinisediminis]